jgi:hypothetical protein
MGLSIRFYQDTVQMVAKSDEIGRAIFEDRDFIEITIPGDTFNIVNRQVTQKDIEQYRGSYDRYKAGLEQSVDGFPLEQWARLSKSQVANYKALNFKTVEQIAEMPQSSAANVGMSAQGDIAAAKAFLAQSKDGALSQKQAVQIETLLAEVARQAEQIKELGALAEKSKDTLHLKGK